MPENKISSVLSTEHSRSDVMSVLGPVHPDALGRTLMHEHLKISHQGSGFDRKALQSRREQLRRAVERLEELRSLGVSTLVDPCPIELGRDVELMAEASQESKVNVICATGFYHEADGVGIPYYWRSRWVSEITELYLQEIEEGIGNTGIRPGVVKAASSDPVGRHDRKVLEAAGRAAAASGVPIITHTSGSRWGGVQQDIFEAAGTDLKRCVIGHLDEAPQAELEAIAERGSCVGIDRIGYTTVSAEESRIAKVKTLTDRGFADRVCLSQDHICIGGSTRPSIWISPHRATAVFSEVLPTLEQDIHGRSSGYILTHFVPRLLESGIAQEAIDQMLIETPKRLLTRTPTIPRAVAS